MIWERKGIINYLTLEGMKAGAIEAIECVKVVRQWLPIKAAKKTLSSSQMMDRWYEDMANRCIAFFGYHPRLGVYCTIGPKASGNLWQELCLAMSELREHYDLQDVDGENRLPHSNVRGGKKLEPIDVGILDRIEQAANGLLNIKEGKQLDERKESIFKERLKTKKSWSELSSEFYENPNGGEALRKEMERYAKATDRKLPNRQR